jgi:hypothetical protein
LKVEIVVYHDPKYPSWWIDEKLQYPHAIASHFRGKGVAVKDANELRSFMIDSLDSGSSHQKLVIFSQDVVPRTVLENNDNSATLREYLDAGGNILWMGDIPLFYAGYDNPKAVENLAETGAPSSVLGVQPVSTWPKTAVTFTNCGWKIGLRHRWSGTRPILKDRNIQALAISECLLGNYYLMDVEVKKGSVRRLWDWLKTMRSFNLTDLSVTFSGKDLKQDKSKSKVHETYINAWVKCYNRDYPSNGFFRIWDYRPLNFTSRMIDELFTISQLISSRIRIGYYLRT